MQNIRNIAIIAHVDHGKTTLVDKIIHATNIFRENQESELIMDNNDLERERGITILSKNISVTYKDTKINVIDTPARRFRRRGRKSTENGRRGNFVGGCVFN
jgi:GTP-binding protein